jgi:hypothetical protein
LPGLSRRLALHEAAPVALHEAAALLLLGRSKKGRRPPVTNFLFHATSNVLDVTATNSVSYEIVGLHLGLHDSQVVLVDVIPRISACLPKIILMDV